jgi:peptidoglycan hydrolase-like protein with peptidoglycan-binding domain
MTNTRRKPMEVVNDHTPTLADHYPFRHSLDTGDKGFLVMWVQSRLAEQGHYQGPLDGRYDREVSLAVRAFQGNKNLNITGVVDRKTWDSL